MFSVRINVHCAIHFSKGPVGGEPGGRVELLHLPRFQHEDLVHVQCPMHLQERKPWVIGVASNLPHFVYFHVANTLSNV